MSGIYIHIPFCRRKCSYCDFYLITNLNIVDRFVSNLLKEIEISSVSYRKEKFNTIFFGGGTPSILSADKLDIIISSLKNYFNISENPEVTIEANPEDFADADFNEYRAAGINRFSFGVQSFNNDELKFLTREHSAGYSEKIIRECLKIFDNVSIDLIYSLPNQKKDNLINSLKKVIELNVPHVSAYTLIFEEQTKLYNLFRKNLVTKNEDSLEAELYSLVTDFLTSRGFNHYEVSNYAKPGYQSKHNLKYWSYENYVGFGPSAHSLYNGRRWNNYRDIVKYNLSLQNGSLPIENEIILNKDMIRLEFIMLALRSKGVDFNRYESMFDEKFTEKYISSISELVNNNLGVISSDNFKLNENGFRLTDEIIAKYF
ncbi:MAG: radical SAM family heme chaperone HemW [Bacteroidetes bacterium]|nr:radical SAM family heme chaperone HemW [Bacteroidota bacterium]